MVSLFNGNGDQIKPGINFLSSNLFLVLGYTHSLYYSLPFILEGKGILVHLANFIDS